MYKRQFLHSKDNANEFLEFFRKLVAPVMIEDRVDMREFTKSRSKEVSPPPKPVPPDYGATGQAREMSAEDGATDEAQEMSAEDEADEGRNLYSHYVNDNSTLWSIEECAALMEAALLMKSMTNAELSIYNKACRYYSAQDASHSWAVLVVATEFMCQFIVLMRLRTDAASYRCGSIDVWQLSLIHI